MGSVEDKLGAPLVDLAAALMNTGNDPVLFQKYIILVAETLAELPDDLSQAIEAGETREAERHAHTFRGLAMQICCGTLASGAHALETALREGRDDEARRMLPEVFGLSESLRLALLDADPGIPPSPMVDEEVDA